MAADEVHCLILTGMSGEDMVVLVAENSEPEVIGIGDVYETIMAEKSIGSDCTLSEGQVGARPCTCISQSKFIQIKITLVNHLKI